MGESAPTSSKPSPSVLFHINVSTMSETAQIVQEYFQQRGIQVYLNTIPMTGATRLQFIENIKSCKIYVIFLDLEWATSAECQIEYNFALNLNTQNKDRTPVFIPIAFPDLVWNCKPHVELLSTNTNLITIEKTETPLSVAEKVYQDVHAKLKLIESGQKVTSSPTNKHLSDYDIDEICAFVEGLGLKSQPFRENAVEGKDLLDFSDEDITNYLEVQPLGLKKLREKMKEIQ